MVVLAARRALLAAKGVCLPWTIQVTFWTQEQDRAALFLARLNATRPCEHNGITAEGPAVAVAIRLDFRIMPLTTLVSQLVYKPNVKINPDDLVTQTTAARMRGVSLQAIEGLVRRGKLKLIVIDGHKFVLRTELENYKPSVGGRPKQPAKRKPNPRK